MRPSRGLYSKLIEGGKKPPTHFHPYQWEFFRVLNGNLTIDLDGVPKHVTKEDGEIAVRPYVHHVIYGTPGTEMNEVEFVVSASDAREEVGVILDQAFFENWYGYQEDVFQRGERIDLIQVLAVSVPHLLGKCKVPLLISMVLDVRCWGLLSFASVVGTVPRFCGYVAGYNRRTLDWRLVGLCAFLS